MCRDNLNLHLRIASFVSLVIELTNCWANLRPFGLKIVGVNTFFKFPGEINAILVNLGKYS